MSNAKTSWLLPAVILVVGLQALPRLESQSSPEKIRVIDAGQYATLQAAFDAVPANGGVVRIPPGEYRITEPLVLSKPETRVEGSGAATKILNANEDGRPAMIVQPATWETDKKTRLWRVQLVDFRLCGDPKAVDAKSTQPKGGDALLCRGVQELYLSGLSIDHHGGNGIHLVDCYEDPRISDSLITYCRQTGIHIENCHDIVVNANQFEENQDALRCTDSFNLCMTGNNIDDHLGNGVIIENTYGSVVSGNMIEECEGTAIILDRDCYGIALSSNVIAHHQQGGIDLRDAHGCTVSANNFVLCNKASLMIGPNSGRITVTGNSFVNSDIGGETKRPREHQQPISRDLAYGVHLDGTADITLTGNTFSGLRDAAVTTRGDCRRLILVGNCVTDVAQDSAERKPWDLSVAKEVVAANNLPQP